MTSPYGYMREPEADVVMQGLERIGVEVTL